MLFPSIVLLVYAAALGTIFFWDVRGIASKVRARFESRGFDGVQYRRLPSWTFRVFGAWCFVFGIGQFVLFWSRHWRH